MTFYGKSQIVRQYFEFSMPLSYVFLEKKTPRKTCWKYSREINFFGRRINSKQKRLGSRSGSRKLLECGWFGSVVFSIELSFGIR